MQDLVIHTDGSTIPGFHVHDRGVRGRNPLGMSAWAWVDSDGRWAAGPTAPSLLGSYAAEAQAVLAAVTMAPPATSIRVMCDNQAVVEDMPAIVRRSRSKGRRAAQSVIVKTPSPTTNKEQADPMHFWVDALARRTSAMLLADAMPEHVIGGWLPLELLALRARYSRRLHAIIAHIPHEDLPSLDHLAMRSRMFETGLLLPDGSPSKKATAKGRTSGYSIYHAPYGWDALTLFQRFFSDGFLAGVDTHHRLKEDRG